MDIAQTPPAFSATGTASSSASSTSAISADFETFLKMLTVQMAGWIGLDVQTGNGAEFTGEPIMLDVPSMDRADQIVLVVSNEQGEELSRIPLPLDEPDYEWSGLDESGDPLPDGIYSFQVAGYENGTYLGSLSAQHFATIVEARQERGELILALDNGLLVTDSQISAVRG